MNLLIRRLGRRYDKVTLLKAGLLCSLAIPLSALIAFQPQQPAWYYLLHALALPIGNTIIEVLPLSIVADICDIDETKSGRRREGAFVGVYNSAFKTGYMFAPALAMVLLTLSDFDGSLVQQSAATRDWLHVYFVAGTFATVLGAVVCSQFIRLSKADIDTAQRNART